MHALEIRDAIPADFAAICALNRLEVQYTSEMDLSRLEQLHSLASFHKVVYQDGILAAFILAMSAEAPYENANFSWFAHKFKSFLYIDRIVVSPQHRNAHLGSLLYNKVFHYAKDAGIPVVTCEYNLLPPNEQSRSFHERFGFKEQGGQWVAGGTKYVSLQAAETARFKAEHPPLDSLLKQHVF